MVDEWLRVEIADGLQGLVALSLDRQPAAEVLTLTADIWVRAFKPRALSESIDAPRIRAGFDAIFGRIREWPAPKQVIDLMPDRPPLPALPLPELSQEEWERGQQRFKEMIDGVAAKVNVRDILKQKAVALRPPLPVLHVPDDLQQQFDQPNKQHDDEMTHF